jgi:hypothetical protein
MPSHIQLFQSSSFPNSEGTGSVNIGVNLSKQLTLTDESGNVTIIGAGGSSIDTGSFVTTSSFNSFTSSIQGQVDALQNATSSYVKNSQTSSMSVATASYVQNAISASYVLNAISSSYASTASYVQNAQTASYLNTLNQDLTFNGNLVLNGTASITFLNVTYESASVIYSSGSNQLGDAINDTQTLIGTVIVSGSQRVTGSLNAPNITGSLYGTASWAENALTTSYAPNALVTASISSNTITFTKGDGNTFPITVNTGSGGGVTQITAGSGISISPPSGLGNVTINSLAASYNTATGSYGSFYDTTIQTNPVGNVFHSMSFNTTDISNGVSISGSTNPFNTYIKTQNAGVYNIQFSAQVEKTDSGTDVIVIWLRKNGIDLTDSATKLTLSGNGTKVVAAWNWFVSSAANDYYQIIWESADTGMRLYAEPINDTPGIPSVILTVNRVDQFLSNTGSFSGSFTGQLIGTASWAQNSTTASYVLNAVSSSFATSASRATTSSYAITASYAMNGGGGGTPGGTAGNIQYKSGSTFGGDPNFNTDGLGGISITGGLAIPNVLSTGNYQLLDSSDVSLNWRGSIAQHIDTIYYFSKKISLTSQRYLAGYTIDNSVPNYEGEIVEATFNSVSNYQLVFLDTDGDWKPVDQSSDTSTKMLGIALPGDYVLLEGNIVAHDGTGANGPRVDNVDHGLPVYIQDGTATGQMDTTLPTTSTTYIRRLGHCYYNSTDDSKYWIFKFRPSNDWTLVP